MTNRDSGKEIQLNAKDKLKWSQQKFDINSTVDTVFSAQKYTIPEKKEITLLVQKLVNQKFDVSKFFLFGCCFFVILLGCCFNTSYL